LITQTWLRKAGSCTALILIATLAYPALSSRQAAQQISHQNLSNSSLQAAAQNKKPPSETPAQLERRRALHALNRLTFGPRPGEVDKVLAKGVDSWVEDQLHPESMDDGALGSHLSAYRALTLRPQELAQTFPTDGMIRQVMAGKRPIPTDPSQKLVYEVYLAKLKQQKAKQEAEKAASDAPPQWREAVPRDQRSGEASRKARRTHAAREGARVSRRSARASQQQAHGSAYAKATR
jgi:hypothetical protein